MTIGKDTARLVSWLLAGILFVLVAIVVVVVLLVPSSSASERGWSDPEEVSNGQGDAQVPQLAFGPGGRATAVWQENGPRKISQVMTSTLEAGEASFSPPVSLSGDGGIARSPQIAFSSGGETTVVWQRYRSSSWGIEEITRKRAGRKFSLASSVSAGPGETLPDIAFLPDGAATAVWLGSSGGTNMIKSATRAPGEEMFAWPAVEMSGASNARSAPEVVATKNNQTAAIWQIQENGRSKIQISIRPGPWSNFSDPQTISSPGRDGEDPRLVAGEGGRLYATWREFDGRVWRIANSNRISGSWSKPVLLSDPESDASDPVAAVGGDGTLHVAWTETEDFGSVVYTAEKKMASEVFSSPEALSRPRDIASLPDIAANQEGTTAVVWQKQGGGTASTIEATYKKPRSGHFPSPERLSAPLEHAAQPDVAYAPDGSARVIWALSGPGMGVIESSFLPYKMASPPVRWKRSRYWVRAEIDGIQGARYSIWGSRAGRRKEGTCHNRPSALVVCWLAVYNRSSWAVHVSAHKDGKDGPWTTRRFDFVGKPQTKAAPPQKTLKP